MLNHVHLLLTPQETLEPAVGLIKGGLSHRRASKLAARLHDHRVPDTEDFEIRRALPDTGDK